MEGGGQKFVQEGLKREGVDLEGSMGGRGAKVSPNLLSRVDFTTFLVSCGVYVVGLLRCLYGGWVVGRRNQQ